MLCVCEWGKPSVDNMQPERCVSAAEGVRAVRERPFGRPLFAELTEFSRDHRLEHLDQLIATELVVETHVASDGRLNALQRPDWLRGLRPSPPRLA